MSDSYTKDQQEILDNLNEAVSQFTISFPTRNEIIMRELIVDTVERLKEVFRFERYLTPFTMKHITNIINEITIPARTANKSI